MAKQHRSGEKAGQGWAVGRGTEGDREGAGGPGEMGGGGGGRDPEEEGTEGGKENWWQGGQGPENQRGRENQRRGERVSLLGERERKHCQV